MLAGPNGAGKSSLYRTIRFAGEFVNADDIARSLRPDKPEDAAIEAGKIALERLDALVASRADFVYETTLSSHQSIRLLRVAREAGYAVLMVFVALQSADLHVLRVRQRVSQGGHFIPETAIRRRYEKTFHQLQRAIPFCTAAEIFDNSGEDGPKSVATVGEGGIFYLHSSENAFDARIAACLRGAGLRASGDA